ncbi:hypothetical protein ACQ4PT_050518 [Festuca glaucescens]
MENGNLSTMAPSSYSDDEVDKAEDAALAAVEAQSNKLRREKKKKCKTFWYPPDEAELLMSIQPTTYPKMPDVSPELEAEFPDIFSQLRATWARCTKGAEQSNMQLLAKRDDFRREYASKGYVTYKAEVSDEDEEEGPRRPRGGGRRRFRVGVVKHSRGARKLN